ncbi:MAG: hypothetical protein ABWY16_10460, partial [Pedobacter sp.]|uniref:hypothetical protein n=1 Tax=Pedobacter sp. TaxID=1411316 RepID=UPI0033991E97
KGLIYGFWMLLIAGISGLLYGLAAGILIQPLIFVIIFSTLLIIVNFFISALLMLLNTVLLMPFKKSFSNITRYFSWSFGIFIVFFLTYTLINYSGIHVF